MTTPTLPPIPDISSMNSPRTGNAVPNQYIIRTPQGKYFKSYDSLIAFIPQSNECEAYLDETFYNYSRTTTKYLNEFLRSNTKETAKKIKEGKYILTNLNK